ncbi:AAA family ATPase [Anaerostipes faecalis]|uniref:AAA family ATPase n=1 Tax=Anaerostipes faecalis TaxID=2738446 RepID=UPI003F05F2BC
MKPLLLELSGWGPYPSVNKIDFSKIQKGELFLITGPTGAGKTTVFDGITYALYGEVSGKTRLKDGLRSDFAMPQTETYVILEFSHGRNVYKVERHPKYMRPKKRGEGMIAEKEDAVLYLEDGSVISGVNQVNQKIREILSVDYQQFKQLSMLAQGEFMDLLITKSKDRVEIFRSIFHTQIYEKMQTLAGEKARSLKNDIIQLENKIEEAVSGIEEDPLIHAELEKKDYYGAFSRVQVIKKQISAEEQKIEKELQKTEEKLRKIEQFCQSVVDLQERVRKTESEADYLKIEAEEAKDRKNHSKEKAELMKTEMIEIQKKKERRMILGDAFRRVEKGKLLIVQKGEIEKKLEQQKIRCAVAKHQKWEEIVKKQQQMQQQLLTDKQQLDRWKEKYQNADENLLSENNKLSKMQSRYFAANVGILAAELKDGQPCPVCGSIHHPQKANTVENAPKQKDVEQQALLVETIQKDFHECYQKLMEYQEKISVEERMLIELQKDIPEEPEWNDGWNRREKLNVADEESLYQQIQREFALLCGKIDGLPMEIKELLKEEDKMRREDAQLSKEIESFEKELEKVLKNAENDTVDYARKKVLLEDAQLKLEHLQKQLPEQSFVENQKLQREQLHQEQFKLKKQKEEKLVYLDRLCLAGSSLKEKLKKRDNLEKKYGIIGDVDRLINGSNHLKLNLEQFVLISYFKDVLKAANLRLRKMTNGRYEMYRQENVSDGRKKDHLEIEVLDYYTGKKRSVRTLSGGESFKAALCLALGLSDVIQSYAGGIQIDILFVDEGFGALDHESLNQAIDTLVHLAGEQRMIGIISHVEELKERIDRQIIIKKKKEGSQIIRS